MWSLFWGLDQFAIQPYGPPKMRYALLWMFRATLGFALIFLIWGGVYLSKRGFPREWRDRVTAEVRKHGIDVSMRKLTLDPINGLVAREVRIVDGTNPRRVLARVDRIALDVNVANLLNGKTFLDAVELRSANLAIPVNPADRESQQIDVFGLNARVLFPPGQIYLNSLDAEVFGVSINASGRLLGFESGAEKRVVKDAGKEREKTQTAATPAVWLRKVESIRKHLIFSDAPPQLEIRFSGDLNRPDALFAEATLNAENFEYKGCAISSLHLDVGLRDGTAEVRALTLEDKLGKFECRGDLNLQERTFRADVRSTMDLRPLVAALNLQAAANNLVFRTPPHLDFSGSGDLKNKKISVAGTFECGKFSVRGTEFDSAAGGISWNGSQFLVDNLTIRNRSGGFSARALNVPGDFRVILDSTINPRDLAPLLSGKAADIMGEWEFATAPVLHLRVSGPAPDVAKCEAAGEIKLGRTRYRKVPMKSATAKVIVKDGACTYQDFKVEREEGTGTGTFSYDFAKHEVRLNNLKMNLIPADVAMWIDPSMVRDVAPYRFKSAPNILVDGTVTFEGRRDTRLRVRVDAPKGMDYTFLKRALPFPNVRANLEFTDRHLKIQDLNGTLFGGKVRGSADISLKKEDHRYSAQIEATDINFPKLTKLYFNYDDSRGNMEGSFRWSGDGSKPRTIDGEGKIVVNDGNVFAIPVLGPLSSLISNVLPGAGYNMARHGSATVQVKNGEIETDDLKIAGSGFEMLGNGKLFFVDDRMDFTIRIDAQGVTGAILSPVSRLFEYTAQSSLSKPVWKPKRLPSL